jgi:imidazolonepropionase-like amidohydrolase
MTALAVVLGVAVGGFSTSFAQDDDSSDEAVKEQKPLVFVDKGTYPSTYKAMPSETTFITNATVLDGKGGRIDGGSVLIVDGKISAVGKNISAPSGAKIIDADGKWVTPGIIDTHSHLGVYASPGVQAHSDGNEATMPNTAQVWAEHAVWPHDPGFERAMAGGVTSLQILPGSANVFGGRGVTLKNIPARTYQGMKFPGAKQGLKMACGENPKRVYGSKGRSPSTRMGTFHSYREGWQKATDYKASWDKYYAEYEAGEDPKAPKRDLKMDTLMGVLNGDILLHNHCYRGDEMVTILDIAKEYNYKISSFHHAIESYKIADYLKRDGVCSSMWADWYGFKMEAYDGIRENIALVHKAGACAIVHSDSADGIQRLNQEASKALAAGKRAGIDISKATAWTWLSLNPAKALGIDGETGSLEAGKNADVVIWSSDPFSVFTKAEKVFVDGAVTFDLFDKSKQSIADMRLGHPGEGDVK